jgi:hypothetical protein
MENILLALRDALVLSIKLFLIVVPLTISYEFLKSRQDRIATRDRTVLGISSRGLIPLVTGIVIGLTYGAGVIIHSVRSSDIGKKEAFLILLFLSICHAIIEDTLIFVVIGANGFILIAARFFLAIAATYIVYKMKLFRLSDEKGRE